MSTAKPQPNRRVYIETLRAMTPAQRVEKDFWALTDSPFDESRFERRIGTRAFGPLVYVTTPEDTVLQKLKWARDCGGGEQQVRDATGVMELQGEGLDSSYLDEWASHLGVADLLAEVRAAAAAGAHE